MIEELIRFYFGILIGFAELALAMFLGAFDTMIKGIIAIIGIFLTIVSVVLIGGWALGLVRGRSVVFSVCILPALIYVAVFAAFGVLVLILGPGIVY